MRPWNLAIVPEERQPGWKQLPRDPAPSPPHVLPSLHLALSSRASPACWSHRCVVRILWVGS